MAIGVLAPVAIQQFFDANGDPLVGGLVQWYLAGTSTPSPVYADVALLNVLPNPVVLDAAGRAPQMFLAPHSYRMVLQTAGGVTIWTADNIFPADPSVQAPLTFVPDATHDIGTSVSGRPRDIFASRDITAGRNLIAGLDVVAGQHLNAAFDVFVGRDIVATRDVTAGRDLTATRRLISPGVEVFSSRLVVPLIAGVVNDLNPASSEFTRLWALQPAGNATINGILSSAISIGTIRVLLNESNFTVTIPNQAAASGALNRFITPQFVAVVLNPWESIEIIYTAVSHWIVMGLKRT
jgi:hypothetical protein